MYEHKATILLSAMLRFFRPFGVSSFDSEHSPMVYEYYTRGGGFTYFLMCVYDRPPPALRAMVLLCLVGGFWEGPKGEGGTYYIHVRV